jgi:hypothetical protein
MMNDKVKMGLIGVVAAALIVNIYFLATGAYSGNSAEETQSNVVANTNTPVTAGADKISLNANAPADKASEIPEVYDGPLTVMNFTQANFDFGTVPQDSENKHVFKFTNTGKEPLVIESAKGSCGCTVPKYPKEPIAPGGTGEIEVVYKPGKQKDRQTKTVTITANTEPRNTTLTISANVSEV